MTVGEMRELMRRRVVPEEIVPQNIIDLLIMDDEDAAVPELDAFTFLSRLRGLGIGSADFVYLMEGCGAPQAVVDRIKNNPAMNLQGLILTLENSELTADDYSRILYTARQIWERTLTLRLRKSEMASQGGEQREDQLEPSFEEIMGDLDSPVDDEEIISGHEEFSETFVTAEIETAAENSEDAPESTAEFEPVPESTAEFEPVSESTVEFEHVPESVDEPARESAAEPVPDSSAEPVPEPSPEVGDEYDPAYEDEPVYTDDFEVEEPEEPEEQEEPADAYTDFAEYGSEPEQPTEPVQPRPYNGDTTAIIKIDADMLRKNLAELADGSEAVHNEAMRLAAEKAQREARAAYEAVRAEETVKAPEKTPSPRTTRSSTSFTSAKRTMMIMTRKRLTSASSISEPPRPQKPSRAPSAQRGLSCALRESTAATRELSSPRRRGGRCIRSGGRRAAYTRARGH